LRNVETGEYGPVHGGRWHLHECRYLAPWELLYHERSARTDEELERAQLKIAIREVHGKQFDLCEDTTTPILEGLGSRRGGKSRASGVKTPVMCAEFPGLDGEIISPTFDKSQIMWRYCQAAIPRSWVEAKRIDEHWIELFTGTRIKFVSAHKPDSVIGEGVSWIGFDELQSIREVAWALALPAVSDGGSAFQIWGCGTPRMGEFKQRHERIAALERQGKARIIHFTYRDNVFIESGAGTIFDLASSLIDPRKRQQELDAEFVSEEGLVYYRFDRKVHDKRWNELRADDVTSTWLAREVESDIAPKYLIGVDYGIGRNYAVIYKVVRHRGLIALWAVAEAYGDRNYDIGSLASELVARKFYPAIICDDATGPRSDGGRAAQFRFENILVRRGEIVSGPGQRVFEVHHYSKNPLVADRVDAMNALMGNALNQVRWYVDANACPRLVESIENQEIERGKPRRSKPGETTYHDMPDAAGYPAVYLFPAAVGYEREEQMRRAIG
jgi:hypothetical protein